MFTFLASLITLEVHRLPRRFHPRYRPAKQNYFNFPAYRQSSQSCRDVTEKEISPIHVLFNVLPKTGSRTLYDIALDVSRKTDRYAVYNTMLLQNETKIAKIEGILKTSNVSTFIYSHMPYLDFSYTGANVVHISIVREPIDRLVSLHYFKIYGDATKYGPFRAKMDAMNLTKESFRDCMTRNGSCVAEWLLWSNVKYFCGINFADEGLKYPTREACVLKAKRNIIKQYLVVGLMEDYFSFVKSLEKLMPCFFSDFSQTYERMLKEGSFSRYKTRNYHGVTARQRKYLQRKMSEDYELFSFITKNFQLLKKDLDV
ncbi:Heparan sulfate 2-O-sulfotransferase 1 [Holothuria leucospilota]|uniref:Heparan sulfate 2-O-sulfotransferase 1 n=1 Tax=Holothuria leucospilota TaxID=206669 RepID=A0A9Q0YKH2_HOLLE|nr:Heparan sulfate 2-O-sulfotransferase 1 [Holothuria leucospilota]